MPKTKRYLPFPLFLLSLAIVSLGVYYTIKTYAPTPQPLTINELVTTGSVSLSLSPTTVTILPNADTTISMVANSGTDRLTIVNFEITYDSTKLTVSAPTVGTWITKVLNPLTIANGKITGQIGAQPDPDPLVVPIGGPELYRTGSGTVLTFKVKGATAGTYPINFNNTPTTAWTITGTTANQTNKLKTTTGTSITISNPALVTDLVGTDHKVDKYDYVELVNQFGKTPAGTADFNHSLAVDGADYSYFMADYGKTW